MRRFEPPQTRARRTLLVPLAVALGVLTGCTPQAVEATSPAARALAALPVENAGGG